MENKNIQEYLIKLGIHTRDQLLSNDINYWWGKQFKNIQSNKQFTPAKKESLLIELNEAKDELDALEIEEFLKILPASRKKFNNSQENNQKQKSSYKNKNNIGKQTKSKKRRNLFIASLSTLSLFIVGLVIYDQSANYSNSDYKIEKNYNSEKNNQNLDNQFYYENYSAAEYFAMAAESIKNEDFKSALEFIDLSIEQDQNNFELYTTKSWIYVVIYENYNKGITNANKAITLNPSGHMAYELRGYAKSGLNYEMNEVCKDFKKAYNLGSPTMEKPTIDLCNKYYNF